MCLRAAPEAACARVFALCLCRAWARAGDLVRAHRGHGRASGLLAPAGTWLLIVTRPRESEVREGLTPSPSWSGLIQGKSWLLQFFNPLN